MAGPIWMPIATWSGRLISPASSSLSRGGAGDDGARRSQRLTARLARGGLEAEQRHRAVADELVEPAAGLLDRLADDREIAVEQEDDVERQPLIGDRGEIAHVAEQHRDDVFVAGRCRRRGHRLILLVTRHQQRHHTDVVDRLELAGEPNVVFGGDAGKRRPFDLARFGLSFETPDHFHATCRAAATPAADGVVRNTAQAAGVEHAVAFRYAHSLAARIVHFDQVQPFDPVACEAAYQHRRNDRNEAEIHSLIDPVLGGDGVIEHGRVDGVSDRRSHRRDRLAGMRKAEQCQDREQDGDDQKPRRGARIPAAIAQPEIEAEAAMCPDDDQSDGLPNAHCRCVDPQRPHHIFVIVPDVVQFVEQACSDDVLRDEQRDQQPEQDLRGLARRHDQRAPAVERHQHQHEMHEQRPVEQNRRRRIAPRGDKDLPPRLRSFERDQVEGVIGEMGDDEHHHHQP